MKAVAKMHKAKSLEAIDIPRFKLAEAFSDGNWKYHNLNGNNNEFQKFAEQLQNYKKTILYILKTRST